MLENHNEKFANLLTGLVSSQSANLGGGPGAALVAADVDITDLRTEKNGGENASLPVATPTEYESLEALETVDKIIDRCASKEANRYLHHILSLRRRRIKGLPLGRSNLRKTFRTAKNRQGHLKQ